MISAPLVIGPSVRGRIAALMAKAAAEPVDAATLHQRLGTRDGYMAHARHMTRQTMVIPGIWNFSVTYSIEDGHPIGRCRHISISLDREGRMPNEFAVWMIAGEFGFVGSLDSCAKWAEDIGDDGRAVNVMQPISQ